VEIVLRILGLDSAGPDVMLKRPKDAFYKIIKHCLNLHKVTARVVKINDPRHFRLADNMS